MGPKGATLEEVQKESAKGVTSSFLFLIANIVTTSKALVTRSDALVSSSLLFLISFSLYILVYFPKGWAVTFVFKIHVGFRWGAGAVP